MAPKQDRDNTGKFQVVGSDRLAEQPICVRYPVALDEALRAMPDKAEWLRRVAIAAARAEGLI